MSFKHTGLLLGLLIGLVGCGTSKALTADELPQPLTLKFRVWTVDGRATYYELEDTGLLRFAGGRAAVSGGASEAGTLSEDQRLQVWQLIHRYQLLDARGSWLGRGDHVNYELHVRAGRTSKTLHASDDAVEGLNQLNDLLFSYQSQLRYGHVIRPIELEIERRKREAQTNP